MMRSRIFLALAAASALAGCSQSIGRDQPSQGLSAVNEPIVSRADYSIDLAAPDGPLSPAAIARLDGWFRSLELGYGDRIFVDGPYAGAARPDVAALAGRYGLAVSDGAPVTGGIIPPAAVRVVVSRTRADVPGCPNWSGMAQPNWDNKTMPNFGCAVNGNLAAMVANPQDLVSGREGSGLSDARTATKPITVYRTAPPTGTKGLQEINTQEKK